MSSQPHTVPSWTVRRTGLPLLSLRCVDCRSESATTGEGRFRVNANGGRLDVWLLVRCVDCDRTNKLTVHERAAVGSFDPAVLDGYHANDLDLVTSRLLDPALARRHHFTLDWRDAWRLDAPTAPIDHAWPIGSKVVFDAPVPLRPDRLLARGLGLSRSEVARRVKADVSLRRPRNTDFAFTLMPV